MTSETNMSMLIVRGNEWSSRLSPDEMERMFNP